MGARRLKGDGNLADEIVDLLFHDATPTEMVKMAKSFLDNTLNHPSLDDLTRAEMIARLCFEHALNPPPEIKNLLM